MTKRRASRVARIVIGAAVVLVLVAMSGPSPGTDPDGSRTSTGLPASASEVSEVRALLREGRYADAETGARRFLAEIEARRAPEDLETARALDLLVECLIQTGKDPEARSHAERAIRIKAGLLDPLHPELAISLGNLGGVLYTLDDWEQARRLHERALDIRRSAFGPDHPLVAQSLYDLGTTFQPTGSWDEARRLQQEALEIRERTLGPDDPLVAQSLTVLGNLQIAEGDLEAARRLHERALDIRERVLGKGHPDVAMKSLHNLGYIARLRGDYKEAQALYERMLDIETRTLGSGHPKVAAGMNNLAILLGEMGDPARAISFAERALEIDEASFGPRHRFVARDLDSLAHFHRYLGELVEARRLSERSLSIMEGIPPPNGPAIIDELKELATIYSLIERYADAKRLYERLLAIMEKTYDRLHFLVAEPCLRLGKLLAITGDPSEARRMLERARDILQHTFGDEHPMLAEVLAELARLDLGEGKLESAVTNALHAETIARAHLRRTARSLPELQALRFEAKRVACLDVPLSILARPPRATGGEAGIAARTWDAVIRSRALLLDEMAERHRSVLGSGSVEISSRAQAVASARRRYTQIFMQGSTQRSTVPFLERLRRARAEMERAERELAAGSDVFRGELDRARAGFAEVLAALPAGSALVAYVQYGALPQGARSGGTRVGSATPVTSYLALVGRGGIPAPIAVPLGRSIDIDRIVERWRREVATPPADIAALGRYAEAGHALRRAIWDPVASHLAVSGRVFVVPDGELHMVNFGTLPTAAGRYLIETGPEISYLSAERDLVRDGERRAGTGGLLVVGGADFDADPPALVVAQRGERFGVVGPRGSGGAVVYRGPTSDCADFQSLRFGPIPGSLAEVGEVGSLWSRAGSPKSDVVELTGPRAGEAAFKRLAPGRRVIHLATHGFHVREGCGPSDPSLENPLLLSGLALAGANRRADLAPNPDVEDGILTAEEIGTLDLREAEWVVLSACESGVGPVQRGEGVLGLRRAFQVAGAGNLIMSLWRVADVDAREWVGNLYEARLSGLTTSEAVRRASVRMLEARRGRVGNAHPFFWGAFVAAGDPLAEGVKTSRRR